MEFTAQQIADFLGGDIAGDPQARVSTVAKIEEGHADALSFLSNPKYEPYVYDSLSTVIIVNRTFEPAAPVRATLIKVDDAYLSFTRLLTLYAASKPAKSGISPQAAVSRLARLGDDPYVGEFAVVCDGVVAGDNVRIYPQVYVGDNVRIGDNVTLYAGVRIYDDCVLGSNVVVHSGTVIGSDGFGFAPGADGVYTKIPQIGNVVVGDDVEIGANTCIDRATMGSTVIGKGVKLDNLIQVGHNVVIGDNTVCAAQSGIAGSSKVGGGCMIAGQVGIAGHVTVGDNVKIGSKSGISNNIPEGGAYMGYPALPLSKFHRANAVYRNLPQMSADLHGLSKQVKELSKEKE